MLFSAELPFEQRQPTSRRSQIHGFALPGLCTGFPDYIFAVELAFPMQGKGFHHAIGSLHPVLGWYLIHPYDCPESHILSPPFWPHQAAFPALLAEFARQDRTQVSR
jgi:hypothetical protein